MARILFTTLGSLGDIHPLMAIGFELQRLGHGVVIATSDRHGQRVKDAGFEFAEIPPQFPKAEDQPRLMQRWMDPKHGTDRVMREFVMPSLKATHHAMEPLVKSADLVITHPFTITAGFLAEKFGKPWMAIPFVPMVFATEAEPPVVGQLMHPERLQWFGTPYPLRWLFRLAKWVNARGWDGFRQIRREMGQAEIKGHPYFDYYMKEASLILAVFSETLGKMSSEWPAGTVQTGFAFYDRTDHELQDESAEQLATFLGQGTPPLVFSLGSTGVYTAGDFYLHAWEAARRLGQRAVLMVGPDTNVKVPQGAGKDCLAVKYAPHTQVFPQASVVIHHGGVNTTGQALRAGRPQLVVPLAHDQFDNAARMVRRGVGLTLPKARFTADRAERMIAQLLKEKRFEEQANEARRVVKSEPGAAGAAQAIHDFLLQRRGQADA
ncbi:MAG: glycosyltransferase [Isosphaeraceae bacterium]